MIPTKQAWCVFVILIVSVSVSTQTQEDVDGIKHVHLIFMNHLDVGYSFNNNPGHVVDVLNGYFTEFFPRASQVANSLLVLGYRERFIYTTHPWLVSLYLDCPPNLWLSGRKLQCPDAENRSNFVNSVVRGDITWHAGPMNMEFEMMDQSMMEFGIQLSIDLDRRFNITRKHRTVSQRDVPGTTKAIIPILAKMGIEALSVGVNGATTPADLPPVFLWKSQNSSIITLYHPGGYPNQYGSSPFQPGGLSRKDCTIVPGLDHALCFAFRSDNRGPPNDYKEVITAYEIARSQFKNAIIHASTFENFISLLVPLAKSLPVVTQEVGDVWIQGGGSDPRKTAQMRTMFRARAECLANGQCSLEDPRVYNSSRFMLKLAEHTWGSAGNCIDNIHWTNAQFYKILEDPDNIYKNATYFWDEQRNFTTLALEALGNHSLAKVISSRLSQIEPNKPDFKEWRREHNQESTLKCGSFQMKFDTRGALVELTDAAGTNWASPDHPMGLFVYQSYNQSDFDKFFKATTPYSKDFFLGIGKPNMSENAAPKSQVWDTWMESVFINKDSTELTVVLLSDLESIFDYGAPQQVFIRYKCSQGSHKSGIDVEVLWANKNPTRLPEGLNFVFMPAEMPRHRWLINKIDELIDPLDVVVNGSQRLHGINRGVYYVDDTWRGLEIVSPDVALVNILTKEDFVSAIPLPLSPISTVTGVAFNMYNNVWETNYIFWYPYKAEDSYQKFRFTLNFM